MKILHQWVLSIILFMVIIISALVLSQSVACYLHWEWYSPPFHQRHFREEFLGVSSCVILFSGLLAGLTIEVNKDYFGRLIRLYQDKQKIGNESIFVEVRGLNKNQLKRR